MNFPVDLCMSMRNQYKIACYTYRRPKYIIFNFNCHFVRYHSILFLYYVNIYNYPFQTTYFKIHQIGIPEVLNFFGAKRWLKYHVLPSYIQAWLQYYKAFVILDTINMNYLLIVQQNLFL